MLDVKCYGEVFIECYYKSSRYFAFLSIIVKTLEKYL